MKPRDVDASYDEASKTLTMTFHGLSTTTAGLDDYVDQTYEKKGDAFVLRVTSMTKYRFEGWTKNESDPSYAAIKQFADEASAAVLEG